MSGITSLDRELLHITTRRVTPSKATACSTRLAASDLAYLKDVSLTVLEPRGLDRPHREETVLEYKLYARGIRPVLVLGVSGGAGREELARMDTAPASAGLGPLGSPRM